MIKRKKVDTLLLWVLVPLIVYNLFSSVSSYMVYGNIAEGYVSTQMIYPLLYLLMACLDEKEKKLLKRLCVGWVGAIAIIGVVQFVLALKLYFVQKTPPVEDKNHTLTIRYVDEADLSHELATTYSQTNLKRDDVYNVKSPTIPGYELSDETQAMIKGVMPGEDVLVVVKYRQIPSVTYTVQHEYYTDGSLTGTYKEVKSGMVGEKISKDSIELRPTYQEVTYTYKSTSPDEITLVADQARSNSQGFVVKYERTTGTGPDEPISAAYTVRHEYYTDGSLTGTYEEVRNGMVGEKISKDSIELRPTYQEVTYTYKSTSPDEITLVAGQTDSDSQEFVLTYERTTRGESDEPTEPGTKPTEPNTKPSKSTPTDDVPATGDDADLTLWLALMGGSGIGIIVVLAMFKMRHKGKRRKR